MIQYGFSKSIDGSIKSVEEKVTRVLAEGGFGILTRIDVKEKFKEKLGIDFHDYVILGACNPPNAHESILAEENIGLMLPCNVILYEKGNKTVVSIIKPTLAMKMIDNPKLVEIAETVENKLEKIFNSI